MTTNKEHRGIVDSVSTLYEGEWTVWSPGRLYPRRWSPKYPLNHRLCGPPVQSEEGENLLLLLGIAHQIIQPVAVYPFLLRGMHLLDTEFLYVKIVMCAHRKGQRLCQCQWNWRTWQAITTIQWVWWRALLHVLRSLRLSPSQLTSEVGYEHVAVCFCAIITKSFSLHCKK
jgi:hypothetical protein